MLIWAVLRVDLLKDIHYITLENSSLLFSYIGSRLLRTRNHAQPLISIASLGQQYVLRYCPYSLCGLYSLSILNFSPFIEVGDEEAIKAMREMRSAPFE
jgi:hypothetical protein